MITYLFYLLASSLWCVGVFIAGNDDDTIIGRLAQSMNHWVWKPVIKCVSCMASVHTALIAAIGHYAAGVRFADSWAAAIGLYIMLVPAVSALNTILWAILHKTIIWININTKSEDESNRDS